jgi:hypothetical protein
VEGDEGCLGSLNVLDVVLLLDWDLIICDYAEALGHIGICGAKLLPYPHVHVLKAT